MKKSNKALKHIRTNKTNIITNYLKNKNNKKSADHSSGRACRSSWGGRGPWGSLGIPCPPLGFSIRARVISTITGTVRQTSLGSRFTNNITLAGRPPPPLGALGAPGPWAAWAQPFNKKNIRQKKEQLTKKTLKIRNK